ncbi:AMP-binding protein [Pleionea sediminis]|uniref:AMP-binding protein n=1 Tax=Pleionea sediminis TaxID=2569479 RepID=UPI001186CE18|nr:AMP-binding protein [Pleionea sediminis]
MIDLRSNSVKGNRVQFLEKESVVDSVTYDSLETETNLLCAGLQSKGLVGKVAILYFSPGLDFIKTFLACLKASVIAVPLPTITSQSKKRATSRLKSISSNSNAAVVLIQNGFNKENVIADFGNKFKESQIVTLEELSQTTSSPLVDKANEHDIAYLQYSSGSTGNPKGVAITRFGLSNHLKQVTKTWDMTSESHTLSWMPHTHDYGLIEGVLAPIYAGANVYIMSPFRFLKRPTEWLSCVSKFGITHSSCPSFAFELCLKDLSKNTQRDFDLSSWKKLSFGAEPINPEAVRKFQHKMEQKGLKEGALHPAYGLAEATLLVSTQGGLKTKKLHRPSLAKARVVFAKEGESSLEVVSCGKPIQGVTVKIVNPVTGQECDKKETGEIWVSSLSNGAGYWQQEALSEEIFRAKLDNDSTEYLRTGDIGFIYESELYIIGRTKDLIIIRGENHAPSDIEQTVLACDTALVGMRCAAFSFVNATVENLVIVCEVPKTSRKSVSHRFVNKIKKEVFECHGLSIFDLVIVPRGTIPRTTSGKIQRRKLAARFSDNRLVDVRYQVMEDESEQIINESHPSVRQQVSRTPEELNKWITQFCAKRTDLYSIDERRCIPPHVILEFGNQGLLGLTTPSDFGGLGGGFEYASKIYKHLAWTDVNLAAMTLVHNSLGIDPIMNFGSEEYKAEVVPLLASGRQLGSFAFTEESAGSHVTAIRSSAHKIPTSDQWRINGKKVWIGNAGWAGVINVFVNSVSASGVHDGMVGFSVFTDQEGLLIGQESMTLGMRGMVQNDITFKNLTVNGHQQLSTPEQGLAHAKAIMVRTRLWLASVGFGIVTRTFTLAQEYAKSRYIATGRLYDNGVTQVYLANMQCSMHCLDALVSRVTQLLDQGVQVPDWIMAAAKVFASEAAWQSADELVQIMGGRGFEETNTASRIMRDVRVMRIFEGTSEVLLDHLGALACSNSITITSALKNIFNVEAKTVAQFNELLEEVSSNKTISTNPQLIHLKHHRAGKLTVLFVLKSAIGIHKLNMSSSTVSLVEVWLEQEVAKLKLSYNFQQGLLDFNHIGNLCIPDEINTLFELEKGLRRTPLFSRPATIDTHDINPDAVFDIQATDNQVTRDVFDSSKVQAKKVAGKNTTKEHEKDILAWMEVWLKNELKTSSINKGDIKITPQMTFSELGLDSVSSTSFIVGLEDWLEIELSPTLIWNYPTLKELACFVGQQVSINGAESEPVDRVGEDSLSVSGNYSEYINNKLKNSKSLTKKHTSHQSIEELLLEEITADGVE